jgi:hypothetical protein
MSYTRQRALKTVRRFDRERRSHLLALTRQISTGAKCRARGNENELVNIVIFGANGPTGRQLVSRALAGGHRVAAVTRHPEQIPPRDSLRVVRGDVTDAAAVDAAVAGGW